MEELEECMHAHKIARLPGSLASVDCVHIDWEAPHCIKKCAKFIQWLMCLCCEASLEHIFGRVFQKENSS